MDEQIKYHTECVEGYEKEVRERLADPDPDDVRLLNEGWHVGTFVYLLYRGGYLRGFKSVKEMIIQKYNLTERDFILIRRKNSRDYHYGQTEKRKEWERQYDKDNKEMIVLRKKEYSSRPEIRARKKAKLKIMNKLYKEYIEEQEKLKWI